MIKTILVIDDSPVSRRIIKRCIPGNRGFNIHEACDGKDGLEKYKETKPEVIFLDLTMPVMDGREFLKEFRNMDNKTLVIVCTADVQKESIDEVIALGAMEVVKKPITKEAIQDALLRADVKLKEYK